MLSSVGRAENGGCQTDNDCHEYEICFPEEGECGDLWVNCQSQDRCGKNETCSIRNHEVVCLPNKTECRRHSDCPETKLCLLHQCADPCEAMDCGENAECVTSNHNHACKCKPGYHRVDPSNSTSACTGCTTHSHCSEDKMCIAGKCEDLCDSGVCGANSHCKIKSNRVSCICKENYIRVDTTDSFSSCQRPRVWSAEQSVDIAHKDGADWGSDWVREARFSVETRDVEVELTRLACSVQGDVDYTVRLHITSQSDTITLTHSAHSTYAWDYIPVSTRDKPVVLRPHTLYNITFVSGRDLYLLSLPSPRYTEPYFHLQFPPHSSGKYRSSVYEINYKTLTFSKN